MIWISVIIPLLGAFVMLKWFREHLAWWEVMIPLGVALLFTMIFKFTVEKVQTSDTEYKGALVVEARYYEYWSTYVRKTCSRTTKVGKTTVTTYYDCSYCDENEPRWTVVNSLGEEFSISQSYYNELARRWKSNPEFVELDRSINSGGWDCGQDGDMYRISWDGAPLTSDATVTSNWYENRVQAAHSVFDFPEVTEDEKQNYELADYPEIVGYKQNTILGKSPKWMSAKERNKGEKLIQHSCGYWGPKKHANIWLVLFTDKPSIAANMQEAYWDGGNDNEVTICVGVNSKTRELQWVKVFSWTPNKTLLVDLREDIMKDRKFDFDKIKYAVDKNMRNYVWKDFEEFNYLTVDPPGWATVVTIIVTLLTTIGSCYWAVVNEYVSDNEKPWLTITKWNRWK